jgi:hypothetical protein
MAKNDATDVEIEISPKEIARALDGISAWINSVRRTVLMLDPNVTVKLKRRIPASVMAPPQIDGCPPPDPCADDDYGNPPGRRPGPRKRPRKPRRPRATP